MSEQNPGRKPLAVYAIVDRKDGQKSFWIKVGAAFVNRDGSTSLLLDAFPIGTNRLQVREARDWDKPLPGAGAPSAANGNTEARP
jgi:hypothetical protein